MFAALDNISWYLEKGFATLVIPNLNIMSYKTKSLVYFSCFVLAATALHFMNESEISQESQQTTEFAETQFEEDQAPEDVLEMELAEK